MTFKVPPRPTGTSREAIYDQWVWDKIANGLRIEGGPGIVVERTSRGISLRATNQAKLPGTITVTACDPNTGDVVTYVLYGHKVTET